MRGRYCDTYGLDIADVVSEPSGWMGMVITESLAGNGAQEWRGRVRRRAVGDNARFLYVLVGLMVTCARRSPVSFHSAKIQNLSHPPK